MFREVEESQTLLINTQTKKLLAGNQEIIKFGFGQSPFLPPQEVMSSLSNAVHRKEYSSVQGDLVLREKMAAFHYENNGLAVQPDNILTAPGSKILLFNILMAFEKADVYLPAPSWVSYAPQAKLAGHNIIKLPTSFSTKWRISSKTMQAAALNKKHETTIMILNYPGNPDGLTYDHDTLNDLANEARKQNILIISDEIYGLLDHNLDHKSFANYYPERTITTTGLSKWCGAGGWRFGAAFLYENIESKFKQALIGIGSETYSCAPMPVQIAAISAYSSYESTKEYLSKQISILKVVGLYCSRELRKVNIQVHDPEGGFYLFLDFSYFQNTLTEKGITTSNLLCEKLLNEAKVALLPGSAFGFEKSHLTARLAYVDFKTPKKGEKFDINTNGENVKNGIKQIVNWIKTI